MVLTPLEEHKTTWKVSASIGIFERERFLRKEEHGEEMEDVLIKNDDALKQIANENEVEEKNLEKDDMKTSFPFGGQITNEQ